LVGVVSTNALELGVDIGELDATLHVGVPTTMVSEKLYSASGGREVLTTCYQDVAALIRIRSCTWLCSGIFIATSRPCGKIFQVGVLESWINDKHSFNPVFAPSRPTAHFRPSLSIVVALDSPFDQYVMSHPQELFHRPIEPSKADPSNAIILKDHVHSATFELPMTMVEAEQVFGVVGLEVLRELQDDKKVSGKILSLAAMAVISFETRSRRSLYCPTCSRSNWLL